MKKIFLNGLVFGTAFCISIVLFYYLAKARSGTTSTPGDKLTSAKRNELNTKVSTLESSLSTLNTTVSSLNSSVPAGSIVAFNLASCPTGRKVADGSNSTPDLRGEFIRGLDNGRGVDSGRTLASSQIGTYMAGEQSAGTASLSWADVGNNRAQIGLDTPSSIPNININRTTRSGTNTTVLAHLGQIRPRNLAFLYCIKN